MSVDVAKIKAKLAEMAKSRNLRMPEVQLLLAQERFLARLMSLTVGKHYIWKGSSLLFRRYTGHMHPRFTIDIDLLLKGVPFQSVQSHFEEASDLDIHDGFRFSLESVQEFVRNTPYGGSSFLFDWTLAGKRGSRQLKVDVCSGDVVVPEAVGGDDVFLFGDSGDVTLMVYPPEYILAEKMHAIQVLSTGNTRLKDFIDVWMLSKLAMDSAVVSNAIESCFSQRSTPIDLESVNATLVDDEFQSVLATRMNKREYARLQLPGVEELFRDLAEFVDLLKKEVR